MFYSRRHILLHFSVLKTSFIRDPVINKQFVS